MFNWKQLRDKALESSLSPHYIRGLVGENEFPVDIERILKTLGVELSLLPDDSPYLAASKCHDDRAVIWFCESIPNDCIRFVVAHELGHILLHSHLDQTTDIDFTGSLEDQEANRFAIDLLIPSYKPQSTLNVDDLIAKFGMSRNIILLRFLNPPGPDIGSKFLSDIVPDIPSIFDPEEIT